MSDILNGQSVQLGYYSWGKLQRDCLSRAAKIIREMRYQVLGIHNIMLMMNSLNMQSIT